MMFLDQVRIRDLLPWRPLIEALRNQFIAGCNVPFRHHHEVTYPGEKDGTLLLMPAWSAGEAIGIKIVNVVPGNANRGLPAISGVYVLCSGKTGEIQAILDGGELTARRTAAASALAATYLANEDAHRLLVVGGGRLSLNLIQAHAVVRPIDTVEIWARRQEQAEEIAAKAVACGLAAKATPDLEAAVRSAQIISCCTMSSEPLVKGRWLAPGTHLDLVGGFKPTMREADDDAILRSTVFVDTFAGAIKEAGDITQPIAAEVIQENQINADLFSLCRGQHVGRNNPKEITIFKSTGTALEDIAAAKMVLKNQR